MSAEDEGMSVEELAEVLGFCLPCADGGKVGARLDDCPGH